MDIRDLAGGKEICLIGRSTAVPTSLIDLFEYNQVQGARAAFAAAPLALDCSSSNVADAAAGTGARTIRVVGLDGDYKPLYEDITMNGQTKVTGVKLFKRVFGARVLTAGTGLVNAGDIHIVPAGTGGTYNVGVPGTLTSAQVKILAGYGQASSGMLTVPAGMTFRATSVILSARGQLNTVFIASQEDGDGVLRHELPVELAPPMNPTQLFLDGLAGFVYPEKTDIRLRAIGATAGALVSVQLFLRSVG